MLNKLKMHRKILLTVTLSWMIHQNIFRKWQIQWKNWLKNKRFIQILFLILFYRNLDVFCACEKLLDMYVQHVIGDGRREILHIGLVILLQVWAPILYQIMTYYGSVTEIFRRVEIIRHSNSLNSVIPVLFVPFSLFLY